MQKVNVKGLRGFHAQKKIKRKCPMQWIKLVTWTIMKMCVNNDQGAHINVAATNLIKRPRKRWLMENGTRLESRKGEAEFNNSGGKFYLLKSSYVELDSMRSATEVLTITCNVHWNCLFQNDIFNRFINRGNWIICMSYLLVLKICHVYIHVHKASVSSKIQVCKRCKNIHPTRLWI